MLCWYYLNHEKHQLFCSMIFRAINLHLVWGFPLDFSSVSAGFGPLPSYYTTERLAGTTWVQGAVTSLVGNHNEKKSICKFCWFVGNWSFCLTKIYWILCELTFFLNRNVQRLGFRDQLGYCATWLLWIEIRALRIGWLRLGVQQQDGLHFGLL